MTLGLEFIGEYGVVQRNFDKLDAEVLGTGGIDAGIRFGVVTITWPGATVVSNSLVVSHGLGVAPVAVVSNGGTYLATTVNGAVLTQFDVIAVTATSFTARSIAAAAPVAGQTRDFAWIAIG